MMTKQTLLTILLYGAYLSLFFGVVKFIFPSLFVISAIFPYLEVLTIPLYVEVWATTIIMEQIFLISPPAPGSFFVTESFTGIIEIVSATMWILILRRYRGENYEFT
jgi:hypothetical protein